MVAAHSTTPIFLPKGKGRSLNWGPRPDCNEIMGAFSGQLIPKLLAPPGVGLIFVRLQNLEIEVDGPVPARIDTLVMDRSGNRGTVSVVMDRASKKIYHYQVETGSRDPLGYESIGSMADRFGTLARISVGLEESKLAKS